MTTREFLEPLIRDFQSAIENPGIARLVLFDSWIQDRFVRAFVRALLLRNGAWRAALQDVRQMAVKRAAALQKWAEEITARPVRGLLEWHGPPPVTNATAPIRLPGYQAGDWLSKSQPVEAA